MRDMGPMQMQNLPPGFPPLDINDPMSAIMAFQAMGLPPLPGFPPVPTGSFPNMERCRDYDMNGFCVAGPECPYSHGDDYASTSGNPDGEIGILLLHE